jgi:phosphate uptake regulator
MESRKIQKVGAATLTISLPKAWVSQRNLKKGDQVFLVEEGKALKVLPSDVAEERRSTASDYIVDSDLCDEPGMLERVIVGNYVLGRERIIVRSSLRLRSDHQDEIRRSVRRLIGMGIVEETSSKAVLQCSINPANYPLDTLVKRLYNLGSTMLSEALEALVTKDPSLAEDAMKREDDADMMYWLILRLVLSAQMDEALVQQLGMRTRLEIPGNRAIARDLEAVADHAFDIASHVKQILEAHIKVPGSVLKAFTSLQDVIEQTYSHALGALLSRDLKQANEAIRLAAGLAKRGQDIVRLVLKEVKDPKAVVLLRGIYASMLLIGEYAAAIAVIGYNRYLEKPSNLSRPASASVS